MDITADRLVKQKLGQEYNKELQNNIEEMGPLINMYGGDQCSVVVLCGVCNHLSFSKRKSDRITIGIF